MRSPAAYKTVQGEERCRHGIWPIEACRICRDEIATEELPPEIERRIEDFAARLAAKPEPQPVCQICGDTCDRYPLKRLCNRCYRRGWWREKHGVGNAFELKNTRPKTCQVPGCPNLNYATGMCKPHWDARNRLNRYLKTRKILHLSVDDPESLPDMVVIHGPDFEKHIYPTSGAPIKLWRGADLPAPGGMDG